MKLTKDNEDSWITGCAVVGAVIAFCLWLSLTLLGGIDQMNRQRAYAYKYYTSITALPTGPMVQLPNGDWGQKINYTLNGQRHSFMNDWGSKEPTGDVAVQFFVDPHYHIHWTENPGYSAGWAALNVPGTIGATLLAFLFSGFAAIGVTQALLLRREKQEARQKMTEDERILEDNKKNLDREFNKIRKDLERRARRAGVT